MNNFPSTSKGEKTSPVKLVGADDVTGLIQFLGGHGSAPGNWHMQCGMAISNQHPAADTTPHKKKDRLLSTWHRNGEFQTLTPSAFAYPEWIG